MPAPVFGSTSPVREHLLRGRGISGEVAKLRKDVDTALSLVSGNSVVWAPFLPEDPGYYNLWEDAVAALQNIKGPRFLYIVADPDNDTVYLPGGTWDLTNTTIVGKAVGTNGDYYRGYQELLYVVGNGNPNYPPTWLKHCAGLKDMYFRQQDYDGLNVRAYDGTVFAKSDPQTVVFKVVPGTYAFSEKDVGKPIRIGQVLPYQSGNDAAIGDNNGTFIITSVIDENTFTYQNFLGDPADGNNGSIEWNLCTSTFIMTAQDYYGSPANYDTSFTLDNVDFRFGGDYDWGSMFVHEDGEVFVNLVNGSSIRWYACVVDGNLTVQSDGSPGWVGSEAFYGNGSVDCFPGASSFIQQNQPAISNFYLYQTYTVYQPNNSGNWNGSLPESVQEALDRLAAAVTSAGYTP